MDCAIVMPVYNEAGRLASTLAQWQSVLKSLALDYVITIINDGSTDETATLLKSCAADPSFKVIHQDNAGHGPAVLRGYREAVRMAPWVFQCDSDAEIPPSEFAKVWENRTHADAVLGCRPNRGKPPVRIFLSWASQCLVRLLFQRRLNDVNVPFRLIRSTVLQEILEAIREPVLTPNIVISGILARRYRVRQVPVLFHFRRKKGNFLNSTAVLPFAFKALRQVLQYRRRIDSSMPKD